MVEIFKDVVGYEGLYQVSSLGRVKRLGYGKDKILKDRKTNNSVGNLEWCDREYNNNYGTRNQRIGVALSKQVKCIDTGVVYSSMHQAQKETGINNGSISSCCNGKIKTAGGYHWQFAKDED